MLSFTGGFLETIDTSTKFVSPWITRPTYRSEFFPSFPKKGGKNSHLHVTKEHSQSVFSSQFEEVWRK